MLDRGLVGGPAPEAAVPRKAQQLAGRILEPDDRKAAGPLRLEPGHHALGRARPVVVQRRRVGDGLVEDVQDRVRVPRMAAGDGGGVLHAALRGRCRFTILRRPAWIILNATVGLWTCLSTKVARMPSDLDARI